MLDIKSLLFVLVFLSIGCSCSAKNLCIDKYTKYISILESNEISQTKENHRLDNLLNEIFSDEMFGNCIELDHVVIQVYLNSGKTTEALEYSLKTLEKDPVNPFSNVFVSYVYQSIGDSDNALNYMKTAYTLMPKNNFIKINYCSLLLNYGYEERAKSLCQSTE